MRLQRRNVPSSWWRPERARLASAICPHLPPRHLLTWSFPCGMPYSCTIQMFNQGEATASCLCCRPSRQAPSSLGLTLCCTEAQEHIEAQRSAPLQRPPTCPL